MDYSDFGLLCSSTMGTQSFILRGELFPCCQVNNFLRRGNEFAFKTKILSTVIDNSTYKQLIQILIQFYRAQNSSTQVDLCRKFNCGLPKVQSLTVQDTSKFISPYCINSIKYIHSLCTNGFKFIRQVLPKRENK